MKIVIKEIEEVHHLNVRNYEELIEITNVQDKDKMEKMKTGKEIDVYAQIVVFVQGHIIKIKIVDPLDLDSHVSVEIKRRAQHSEDFIYIVNVMANKVIIVLDVVKNEQVIVEMEVVVI